MSSLKAHTALRTQGCQAGQVRSSQKNVAPGVRFAPVPQLNLPSSANPLGRQGVVFAPLPGQRAKLDAPMNSPQQPGIVQQRPAQPSAGRIPFGPQVAASSNTRAKFHHGVVFAPVPQPGPAQRTGNSRPVDGLPVARGHVVRQAPAIQRYIGIPATQAAEMCGVSYGLRVSDDGKMAVRDTLNETPAGTNEYQDVYLAHEVLEAAQQALGWVNSGVSLISTQSTIAIQTSPNSPHTKLAKVKIIFADFSGSKLYEDCDAVMGTIVGTSKNLKSTDRKLHAIFKRKIDDADDRSWALPARGIDIDPYAAMRKKITQANAIKEARPAWETMSDTSRDTAAKIFGINQYAKPEVGQGVGVFKAGTTGSTKYASGHFAGVIARSGGDYITLENFAGNPGTIAALGARRNPNWYVRMFGKGGQSFYGFHKTYQAAEFGDQPMVVRYAGR